MNRYKQFLRANGLKQIDLAKYLGITESHVSNLCRGKSNLSEEKLAKLLENDRGWDVSMLVQGGKAVGDNSGVFIAGNNHLTNSPIDNRRADSSSPDVLRTQIELLGELIKEKDAQIKEKDAQIKKLLDILSNK